MRSKIIVETSIHIWDCFCICGVYKKYTSMLINQRLYFSRELESRDVYRIGLQIIDLVQQYKYLDILFEYLKFEPFCRSSCSRALPLFISNFSVKHVVIMYLKCNRIQHRTMRFFLVAHKYTPIHVLHWDIEWFPLFSIDRSASIVRFWNRLNNMSNDRLTKTVCFVALTIMSNNLSSYTKTIPETSQDIVDVDFKRECKFVNRTVYQHRCCKSRACAPSKHVFCDWSILHTSCKPF